MKKVSGFIRLCMYGKSTGGIILSIDSQLELRGISTFSNIKNLTNSGITTKASTGKTRKSISYIAHIDMDAFFASVEQAANPYLKNKPVIVTGKDTRHSVVTSASYEAKKHGIKAGMPAFRALQLCPDTITVPVDGSKYTYVSEEIMKRLEFISPRYSVASIDEAFIDLSIYNTLSDSLKTLRLFKKAVEKDFGISFSIGVAVNPLIAKIASDFKKPRGFVVVESGSEKEFLKKVDISDVPGIGPHTLVKLKNRGYVKTSELLEADDFYLYNNFGNSFLGLIKSLKVKNYQKELFFKKEPPKSVGHSMTLNHDIDNIELIERVASFLGAKIVYRMRKYGFKARGISLYLKNDDFHVIRTTRRLSFYISRTEHLNDVLYWLSREIWNGEPIRAIGVSLYKLKSVNKNIYQEKLFKKEKDTTEVVIKLQDHFGKYALFPASILSVASI